MKLTKTTTFELSRDPETVDHRSGFQKLKDIIFDLRAKGYRDEDEIPFMDVEDSIFENCGIDDRTVRKYLKILVKRDYLRPVGHLIKKRTRVNVTTFSRVDSSPQHNPKEYTSTKGHSFYVFGLFAPKHFRQEQIPPTPPLSDFDDRSMVNMENMCVRVSRGQGERIEQVRRIEERERENTVAHTHNLCHIHNISRKVSDNDFGLLSPEELLILRSAKGES